MKGPPGDQGPQGEPGALPDFTAAGVSSSGAPTTPDYASVSFSTTLFDPASAASSEGITVASDGPYVVCASVQWAAGTGDIRALLTIDGEHVDEDERAAEAGVSSLIVNRPLAQGQLVRLAVASSEGVAIQGVRLSLLGGGGQRLFWLGDTYFDADLAGALEGSFDIQDDDGDHEPAPDHNQDGDYDCGSFQAPAYPYTDEPDPDRPAVRLKASPGAYAVTWASRTNDECPAYPIEHRATAVEARGIAKLQDADTSFGLAFETAGGSRLYVEWQDDEIHLSQLVGSEQTEIESWPAPNQHGRRVPYVMSVDLAANEISVAIDRQPAHLYALEGAARRRFNAGVAGRGGMFTHNGNTRLVPGAQARQGAVIVSTVAGDTHVAYRYDGLNRPAQIGWTPMTPDATPTPHVQGRVRQASVGRKLLVSLEQGTKRWEQTITLTGVGWSVDFAPPDMVAGAPVRVYLDDPEDRQCDPIVVTALSYHP